MEPEKQSWNIKKSLEWGIQYLKEREIENPQANAELIMGKILNRDRLNLYLTSNDFLLPLQINEFQECIKKRARGIPLPYINNESYFMGLRFRISFDVYIPRPETELLVEKALNLINSLKLRGKVLTLVDLGTGCGNIAVSLAKKLEKVKIYGIDISSRVLKVAEENIKLHGVEKQVEPLLGDIFSPLKRFNLRGKVDGIISNPPYVSSHQINSLSREVRKEPKIALNGGENGLEFFERIIPESSWYLKREGFLIMEIGYNQGNEVKQLILSQRNMKFSCIIPDYQGNPRIAIAIKKIK